MRKITLAILVLATLVPWADNARGGPFRLVGYDSFAVGQAGTQGAFGQGTGVLYSNPALLTDLAPRFDAGMILVQPFMDTSLMDRPAGTDIPITFYDSDVGIEGSNLDRPLPTAELPRPRADNRQDNATAYLTIGLIHDLGIEDFRLGLALLVPTAGFASVEAYYPDEREQYFSNTVHFTRFGEWSRVLSILAGAAYRPLEWLSVGASVEGSLGAGAVLDAFIPEATVQDYALANMTLDAGPVARAIIGVTARPLDMFSFSLVWRDRRFTKIDTEAKLNLWNYHESGDGTVPKRVEQRHLLALDFEPMEVCLSAGIRLGTFSAELGVTWNHWSDFLDSHHKRAQETAEFEDPNNPGQVKGDGDRFAFSDTFSVSLGATWAYLEGFTLVGGVAWRPTPVPPQVGRTNYVDNDLLAVAAGHRFGFSLWGQPLEIDLGLQLWTMFEATVHKDPALVKDEFADRARTLIGGQPMPEAEGLQTNNPGFPGYEFGGMALVGSATLRYVF